MRLIDADKLRINCFCVDRICVDGRTIENAPTVKAIPIDKPFLKMRYGDYVVYDKKWLVNHLQTEWNILQGKEYRPSIPIEFIEEQIAKTTDINNRDELDVLYAGNLGYLLKLWEKENGN